MGKRLTHVVMGLQNLPSFKLATSNAWQCRRTWRNPHISTFRNGPADRLNCPIAYLKAEGIDSGV